LLWVLSIAHLPACFPCRTECAPTSRDFSTSQASSSALDLGPFLSFSSLPLPLPSLPPSCFSFPASPHELLEKYSTDKEHADSHSRVIIPKHLQPTLGEPPNSHRGEQRDQVPRLASRVFADLARGVGAGRVEVAEGAGAELGIGWREGAKVGQEGREETGKREEGRGGRGEGETGSIR
jgi:hypothetical protein